MEKIKIISNAPIIKPKSLENIDVSLGISYFSSNEKEVKVIENDWGFKLLSKISKVTQVFTSKIFSNKDIIDQVLEDSKFVLHQQAENADNLHIQINQNGITANILNSLAAFNILKRINYLNRESKDKNLDKLQDVLGSLDTNAGHIYSDTKKMFLGTSFFEKKNSLYKNMTEKLTKKEAVSFVFYHEYSHSSELMNNGKYGKEKVITNTSLDNFYSNLIVLSNDKTYCDLIDRFKSEGNLISAPNKKLIDTLHTLHKEIYADVGALLLMRNKAIHDGTYNQENFKEITKHIVQVRKEEKKESMKIFNNIDLDSFMHHEHFTSPGVESLLKHLENVTKQNPNRTLSEQEIHEITTKCVQEGVYKTVLAMIRSDNTLVPKFNTLFSLRVNNLQLNLDKSKNHYLESINKMKEIVPKEWTANLDNNIKEMNNAGKREQFKVPEDLIFDAALDYASFNEKLKENKHNIDKINELESVSQNTITNEDPNINVHNISKIKTNMLSLRQENLNSNKNAKKITP